MKQKFDSAKMGRSYHHGDLRQALVDSALAVLAEKGARRSALRETARRVGVSPVAPKHHFTDTRGLLTALATIAFTRLAKALERADKAAGKDRHDRLMAQGEAYIDFAIAERALFDLMWRVSLLAPSDSRLLAEKARVFDSLDRLIRGAAAPRIAYEDPAMTPTIACWSLVHGFARLMLDGGLGQEEDAYAPAADILLPAMLGLLHIPDWSGAEI